MIQLLGICFGQEASTLYVGGACALAIAQTPRTSKQMPIDNETVFVHPLKLAMTSPPIRKPEFPFWLPGRTGIYTRPPAQRMIQSSFSAGRATDHVSIKMLISFAAAMASQGRLLTKTW
jgi:hypothetical protein